MRACKPSVSAGVIFVCLFTATAFGGPTVCNQPVGPDVIVGDIVTTTQNYSTDTIDGVTYDAFSFGTTSCNIGNANLLWYQNPDNRHPVIGQGLFRLKDGRFEQVGLSWLKHGFAALAGNICGCGCANPGTQTLLGVGCSDPYTAFRNGSQGGLGPRYVVNAHTGYYPPGFPPNPGFVGTNTGRRLRVRSSDLEATSASVRYFVECQYVTQDDSANNNHFNNASYRECTLTGGPANFTVGVTGSTQRERAAIRAWKVADPTVVENDILVLEPNGTPYSLMIISAKATSLGGGMWRYEYALQNLNSDQSGASFTVPLPDGTVVSNVGFHDVEYHSGDGLPTDPGNPNGTARNYDGTDWVVTESSNSLKWATAHTFAQNPNANALRWGSLYNFRFDANKPPRVANAFSLAVVGLFKNGADVNARTVVPDRDCNSNNVGDSFDILLGTSPDVNGNGIPDECEPPTCLGDISPAGGNGVVNIDDLFAVINSWGPCPAPPAPCLGDVAPAGGNGVVNIDDLFAIINAWGPCPTP